MERALREYRRHLVLADQRAQADYDRTVVTLSGGALGVSFAFVDWVATDGTVLSPVLLFLSWLSWGVSVGAVLISYYFSQKALRRAMVQVDAALERGEDVESRPGGWFATLTGICNVLGGVLFVAGVVLIAIFVHRNLLTRP
jgi:hypothetical protein